MNRHNDSLASGDGIPTLTQLGTPRDLGWVYYSRDKGRPVDRPSRYSIFAPSCPLTGDSVAGRLAVAAALTAAAVTLLSVTAALAAAAILRLAAVERNARIGLVTVERESRTEPDE